MPLTEKIFPIVFPESPRGSTESHLFSLRLILILRSYLLVDLASGIFPAVRPTNYAFSSDCTVYPFCYIPVLLFPFKLSLASEIMQKFVQVNGLSKSFL
jgi:hypothetical protein